MVEDEQLHQRRHAVERGERGLGRRLRLFGRALALLLFLAIRQAGRSDGEVEDAAAADDDADEEAEQVEEDVARHHGVHDVARGEDAELGGVDVREEEDLGAEEGEEAEIARDEARRVTATSRRRG